MEIFPEDPFETVKARIVGGAERQVVRVSGGNGRGHFCFLSSLHVLATLTRGSDNASVCLR